MEHSAENLDEKHQQTNQKHGQFPEHNRRSDILSRSTSFRAITRSLENLRTEQVLIKEARESLKDTTLFDIRDEMSCRWNEERFEEGQSTEL